MTTTVIEFTNPGFGVWIVPNDWNSGNNKIECTAGGAGTGGVANSGGSGGAGGGAYAASTNVALTPGTNQNYHVGEGGAAGSAQRTHGQNGGDTWIGGTAFGDSTIGAKGGSRSQYADNSYSANGAGGSSSTSRGDVRRSGGSGAGVNTQPRPGGSAGNADGPGVDGDKLDFEEIPDEETMIELMIGHGASGVMGVGSGYWVPGNTGGTGRIRITYTPLVAPTVTTISPTNGFVAGGDTVVLTGADFDNATAVKFGISNAASFTIDSPTQITAVTPAHSAGTVDVSVTNIAGTGTKENGFTFKSAPQPPGAPYIFGV